MESSLPLKAHRDGTSTASAGDELQSFVHNSEGGKIVDAEFCATSVLFQLEFLSTGFECPVDYTCTVTSGRLNFVRRKCKFLFRGNSALARLTKELSEDF